MIIAVGEFSPVGNRKREDMGMDNEELKIRLNGQEKTIYKVLTNWKVK